MKLNAVIGGETREIEITTADGKVTASIDGRTYEVEASEPEPNVFLLKHGGRVHEVFVSPPPSRTDPLQVRVGTNEFEIALTDPKRLRSSAGLNEHGDGLAEIKTAMPGKVVRILKAVGESVGNGDGVIVVEAMKMQNEMRSPKDGVVREIRFAEGDTVKAAEVLMVIE